MSIKISPNPPHFWVTDLPIVGSLQILYSPAGITRIHMPGRLPPGAVPASTPIPEAYLSFAADLRTYFHGRHTQWDVPLDLQGMDGFMRDTLELCRQIPYGQTRTYGDLAAMLNKQPAAARAVGMCMAANPIPIVIPCHRVVGKDGKLHGYSGVGGIQTKAALLQLEGARLLI